MQDFSLSICIKSRRPFHGPLDLSKRESSYRLSGDEGTVWLLNDFSGEDREFLLAANRIVALKECDAELTKTEQVLSANLARVLGAEDSAIIERTMQRLLLAGSLRAEIARLLTDSEAILRESK